ncbi:MAG: hypothetical protein WCU80_05205 [Paludibacteraceae bacterium]|nr:hypothetical protein [Prevotellaceae bacterium]
MNKFFPIAVLFSFFSCLLISCEDDDFTSDASYQLTLSTDTISFDTIFSNILTSTKRIMVYNKTSENIRIDAISLESGFKCFQINVNGQSGTTFNNIEIRANDSIYIFVQARLNGIGQNAPLFILDSLVFRYNGNVQNVKLCTYGQDVHLQRNTKIEEDTHWTNDKPYLIYDTLCVDENATLTIDAGTKIYFYTNACMKVNGVLKVLGDIHYPVLFRGHRTDYIYDNIPYDKIVGQWGGIIFSKESYGNKMEGAVIRSSDFGIRMDSSELKPDVYKLILANSTIHNTKGVALKATNAKVYAYNTVISNSLNACVMLEGGDYLFNHCTIANFPKNSRYHSAVMLLNKEYYTKEPIIPLVKADFNNCIIYGTYQQEMDLEGEDSDENFNYHFNSCLIKYVYSDNSFISNERFSKVIWNEDPLFKLINHTEYEYDYSIDSLSAAINKADVEVLNLYPECNADKAGRDRNQNNLPDIGAYEWQPAITSEN